MATVEADNIDSPAVHVSGIGVVVPEPVSVEDAVRRGLYPAEEAGLHQLGGAAVAGEVPAPEMALHAARQAFERCGRRPRDIDLLLYADTWHQGPDGWLPHSHLQRHLVGGDALAVGVRQGCSGMFSALELAAAYLRASPGRSAALLVTADNYGTPLMDRWLVSPGAVLGDAATAVVLTKEPGFARLLAVSSGTVPEAEGLHRGNEPLFPPGITVGRPMDFRTRADQFRRAALSRPGGTAAFEAINRRIQEVARGTAEAAGIKPAEITRVAFTHTSREIFEQKAVRGLGLRPEQATWDFAREVGHLGASDQFAAFDRLLSTGELRPGDHMLMIGISPGFTVSAAVLRVSSPPPWLDGRT